MTEELGTKLVDRKRSIEAELQRLQNEAKKGSDFLTDLQRQQSDIQRQLQGVQAEFTKQSGKLEEVNELIGGMKKEVTPKIPSKKK